MANTKEQFTETGREPPIGKNKQLSMREDEQCGKNALFLVELQKGQCGVRSVTHQSVVPRGTA